MPSIFSFFFCKNTNLISKKIINGGGRGLHEGQHSPAKIADLGLFCVNSVSVPPHAPRTQKRPKSAILIGESSPSCCRRKFSGFKSRCTIFLPCKYESACISWRPKKTSQHGMTAHTERYNTEAPAVRLFTTDFTTGQKSSVGLRFTV